jgi:hypothetical protein
MVSEFRVPGQVVGRLEAGLPTFLGIGIIGIQRGIAMKWVEIISLRSPTNIDIPFVDELLKGISESDSSTDTPGHLVEIRVYHHSIVETDLSIHIYWESEKESQRKSSLGLRFSSALKPLGLLNHSVWIETATRNLLLE